MRGQGFLPYDRPGNVPFGFTQVGVTILNTGAFKQSGNATTIYAPGVVVYVPATGRFSAVASVVYDGVDTHVFLSDNVLVSSSQVIAYADHAPDFTNLATDTARGRSNGDYAPNVCGNAFDGSYLTTWITSASGTATSGNSWLGYQFASAVKIRWVRLLQINLSPVSNGYPITSIRLRYSDDGTNWTIVDTFALDPAAFQFCITTPPAVGHTYWSILANANPVGTNYWGVRMLQMGE